MSTTQVVVGLAAELHTDGSSFIGRELFQEESAGAGVTGPYQIFDSAVVEGVATGLQLAALHAVENTCATGEALLEGCILEPRSGTAPPSHSLELHWEPVTRRGIVHPERYTAGRPLFVVPPSRHTVDLSAIIDSMIEWMVAARLVATDLLQAFACPKPCRSP
jgi:hypothetical protein